MVSERSAQFIDVHEGQLAASGLPRHLWGRLADVLVGGRSLTEVEEQETASKFELVDVDGLDATEFSFRLVAKEAVSKEAGVFILEHAWTPLLFGDTARKQLLQVDPLRDTLWHLLQCEKLVKDEEKEGYGQYQQAVSLRSASPGLTLEDALCTLESVGWDIVEAMMKVEEGAVVKSRMNAKRLPYPSNMVLCEGYCWREDKDSVEVYVALPADGAIDKKQIKSVVTRESWRLSLGDKVLIEGKLAGNVDSDSMWQMHNERTLLMYLEKQSGSQEQPWSWVVEGEERVQGPSLCKVAFNLEDEQADAARGAISTVFGVENVINLILERVEQSPGLGQYFVYQAEKVVTNWFLHSELGCGVQLIPFEDTESDSVNCGLKVFIDQKSGRTLSMFWPQKDLKEGDVVTCRRISGKWVDQQQLFRADV